MPSHRDNLTKIYSELSRLYKNPTGPLRGMAASNQDTKLDTELANKHKKLLHLFNQEKWDEQAEKPAPYFKILSLLYEIDDYRGVTPAVEELILTEYSTLIEQFDTRSKRHNSVVHQELNFEKPGVRSLWKAKVLCCVAAIESRRKVSQSNVLLSELSVIEEFIKKNLHKPEEKRPAWTTLAFVCAAQARIARQKQMYSYMREKLLDAVKYLDERAAEIIKRLSDLREKNELTKKENNEEIEKLGDDLVFIRRKQTLSTSFNVGLSELQRGSLRFAAYACQAAQLEFRLHGQIFHRLFNELMMLSIKRAQISRDNRDEFLKIKDELERDIIPWLKPEGHAGNPKLYLYALREKTVIQYYCGEYDEMLKTLDLMETIVPSSQQWNSRINHQRARAHWRRWVEVKPNNDSLLQTALNYSEKAFHHASGLDEGIESYIDTKKLIDEIESSESKTLIDTIESLITYGDVQVGLKNLFEATKSADAVIRLCKDNNPRLLAMGHLVMAEAHFQNGLFVEANQHLASAKILEKQIDHEYVADRIRAVEKLESMRKFLDLSDCTDKQYGKAEDLLLGWFIEHWSDMSSVNKIATDLGLNRKTILNFLERLDENSPYHYLQGLKDKYKSKRRVRRSLSRSE